METFLFSVDQLSTEKIHNRQIKTIIANDCDLSPNDLVIFYTNAPSQKIDIYGFVERATLGTPAQIWKRSSMFMAFEEDEFFELYHESMNLKAINLKCVRGLRDAIYLEDIYQKIPDFYVPKDFCKINLDIFNQNFSNRIDNQITEHQSVYLADHTETKECYLSTSKSIALIEQHIRYYHKKLELVAAVALNTKEEAFNYLNQLREKYIDAWYTGKWYEFTKDESYDVIEDFNRVYDENKIHLYYDD